VTHALQTLFFDKLGAGRAAGRRRPGSLCRGQCRPAASTGQPHRIRHRPALPQRTAAAPGLNWLLKTVKRSVRAGRSFSVVLKGRLGQAYNEDAFRYFLGIERSRAARLGRPFLLALIGLRDDQSQARAPIDQALAAKLFTCLWRSLRETDVIGWYRENHVAAAVLTQLPEGQGPELSASIRQRVSAMLATGLPAAAARRLQVHVYQLGPKTKA
jgi:hypothetical protein